MKDERIRGGNIQWYLIILLLLCVSRDKDPLFGYRKTLCLASVNIMTACLSDTLAAFLSYLSAVVDPVLCPILFVEDRKVPVYVPCLKLMYYTLPTFVIYMFSSGFGGLEVVCWPLVPKFAGSNPAEAVEKNP